MNMKFTMLIVALLLAVLPESVFAASKHVSKHTHHASVQMSASQAKQRQAVAKLQRELCKRGYKIAIDGIYGPQTKGALYAYQQSRFAKYAKARVVKAHRPVAKLPRGAKVTKASVFGLNVNGRKDRLDNGVGSPYLSDNIKRGIRTDNTQIIGVAVPADIISKTCGVPMPPKRCDYPRTKAGYRLWAQACRRTWEAWEIVRRSRVEIICPTTGKRLVNMLVKMVDLGPGDGPRKKGVELDTTFRLHKMIGGDGMVKVAYRILKPRFAGLASGDREPHHREHLAPVGRMLAQR